jgi:hypothetical protein
VCSIDRSDARRGGLKQCLSVPGPIALAPLLLVLFLAGCSRRESADEAIDRVLKETGQTRHAIARFGGKVTIDGKAPEVPRGQALVVILYDPQHPPANHQLLPQSARCRPDGSFVFNTYGTDDGAPAGKYIVLFAELEPARRGFRGPDGLKNLYNDPDKNEKDPQFQIDLTPPGKLDWYFDLQVANKDPNNNPGPHAATGIIKGG